jgi:hypothetical protein
MCVVGYVGYNTYKRDGLNFRKNATLTRFNGEIGHLEYHKYIAKKYFICTPKIIADEALNWEGFVRCMQSKPTPNVDIALVGDSHAEHLFLGMAEALPTKNVVFYIKGSPPFIGNPEFKNIFATILKSKTINEVVLTMYWFGRYSEIPTGSTLDKELIKVIDALSDAGKMVYLTDDVPSFPFSPDKCQGRRWLSTKNLSCQMSIDEAKKQTEVYIEALNKVVKSRPKVRILNVGKYLCDDKVCNMTKGNEILYRDNNHLNLNGSLYIGERLVEDNVGVFN